MDKKVIDTAVSKYKATRHRVERALQKMGYQYSVREESDRNCCILLPYQGEDFEIYVNPSDYLRVILYDVSYCRADDLERFSRLRRAVNEANWESGVTIVYTIQEDRKSVLLTFSTYALAVPEITGFAKYIERELNGFFRAQQNVMREMYRIKKTEEQNRATLQLPSDEYSGQDEYINPDGEHTRLVLDALDQLGCPYETDEDQYFIVCVYKDTLFFLKPFEMFSELYIVCNAWQEVDMNDVDEVMRWKQAVNQANSIHHSKTYYKNDYDDFKMRVSTSESICLSPEQKNLNVCLKRYMDDMLDAQQTIQIEAEQ